MCDSVPGPPPLVVARLRRAWGRRGELLADRETDWPEQRFAAGARVTIRFPDGRAEERVVSGHRVTGSGLLLAFEGVCGIDDAETLAGAVVTVAPDHLPEMGPEDLHVAQLLDLEVVTREGERVGRVADLAEGCGQDRLVVRLEGGGTVEIPFVDAICVSVDPEAGRVVVDLPDGLIDPSRALVADPGAS